VTTDAVRAAAALREAEANLRSFVEHMPDALCIHRGGMLVVVNQPFADLLGYASPAELVGTSAFAIVHPGDADYVRSVMTSAPRERAGASTREHRLVRKDGTPVLVEVTGVPVALGGDLCALTLVRDLREKKRVEAQLVMNDRMASLGRLSAAVGHEINNPLAYAIGALDLMRSEIDALAAEVPAARVGRLRELLGSALEGSARVRTIVRDLKALSGGQDDAPGPIDLERLVDISVSMAGHEIRHRARLVRDYERAPTLYGSAARLGQVFLNLLVNAAQAVPEGDIEGNEIRVVIRTDAQGRARVDVVDTGAGVKPDLAERIFEPFFTTKAGQGSGLGLSISRQIVASLGGTLTLEPNVPRGTRFRVVLPVRAAPALEIAPPPPLSIATGASVRALVVDDEPRLAELVRIMLGGERVVTATSGADAIELLRAGEFDVIVCDLHMADLSGIDVYEHLEREARGRERRMLFMTGGAVGERAQQFVKRSGCPVLEKPFDHESLLRAVDALLATFS
jgi:PAS domain S-box-containing protein